MKKILDNRRYPIFLLTNTSKKNSLLEFNRLSDYLLFDLVQVFYIIVLYKTDL